jgi:hypothetical protein
MLQWLVWVQLRERLSPWPGGEGIANKTKRTLPNKEYPYLATLSM